MHWKRFQILLRACVVCILLELKDEPLQMSPFEIGSGLDWSKPYFCEGCGNHALFVRSKVYRLQMSPIEMPDGLGWSSRIFAQGGGSMHCWFNQRCTDFKCHGFKPLKCNFGWQWAAADQYIIYNILWYIMRVEKALTLFFKFIN